MFDKIVMLDYGRPLDRRVDARKSCGPYTWAPTEPNSGRGFYQAQRSMRCDPRGSTFDLRLEECGRPFYPIVNGYRVDSEFQPIVARLPRGRGFLAGWSLGAGMAACLEPERHVDLGEAVIAAKDAAERAAEREAEYLATESEDDD